jgi:hypothetical protein
MVCAGMAEGAGGDIGANAGTAAMVVFCANNVAHQRGL